MNRVHRVLRLVPLALAAASCDPAVGPSSAGRSDGDEGIFCRIDPTELIIRLRPEGIPALTDPPFVSPDAPGTEYLEPADRVVGMIVAGQPLAFPLKILRWHENVNLTRGTTELAVTYCPLTGTALVFDRSVVGGVELGISGMLYRNNVVLFDRGTDNPSFLPQMTLEPQCGPWARSGTVLPMVASWELRWDGWLELHPNTLVLSGDTGFPRPYHQPPDAEYERLENASVVIPVPIDPRRPPKERVLGIPTSVDGGPAFPFEIMKRHKRLAVPISHRGRPGVVFWDRSAEGALAFYADPEGQGLSFDVTEDGFRDTTTGSGWRLDGLAVTGALAGTRLEPVPQAYVGFWFAWADFHPETWIWGGN